MSILTADNLGFSFGAFDLFKGISATIANDSKIGLIGPNGLGRRRCSCSGRDNALPPARCISPAAAG